MNQANGYWSSPDHYWGNQMAPKIEIFNDPFWRNFRFFLVLSINPNINPAIMSVCYPSFINNLDNQFCSSLDKTWPWV